MIDLKATLREKERERERESRLSRERERAREDKKSVRSGSEIRIHLNRDTTALIPLGSRQ